MGSAHMFVIFYIFIGLIVCFELYLAIKFIEYFYCACIMNQPPNVDTPKKTRQKIIEQINTYYKNAKTVCDIGSGYGNLARYIQRHTKTKVFALENMAFSAFVSKVIDLFYFGKTKTIWCDAYKYLDKTNKVFDIGIAYLGPIHVQKLKKYKKKVHVLICLDFKLNNIKPVRVIDAGRGYTRYNNKKYPHKLFIYEFK